MILQLIVFWCTLSHPPLRTPERLVSTLTTLIGTRKEKKNTDKYHPWSLSQKEINRRCEASSNQEKAKQGLAELVNWANTVHLPSLQRTLFQLIITQSSYLCNCFLAVLICSHVTNRTFWFTHIRCINLFILFSVQQKTMSKQRSCDPICCMPSRVFWFSLINHDPFRRECWCSLCCVCFCSWERGRYFSCSVSVLDCCDDSAPLTTSYDDLSWH